MPANKQLFSERFPRSAKYNPEWVLASASGGANSLWLVEWLAESMDLEPGMRVLDLGCGRAASSIFLNREFGVEVWAADLWFNPSENLQRIDDADVEKSVFPIHAEAHALPFARDFFDAIVCIDSFMYYGTDDHYLNYLARYVRPGGEIGIAGAGLMQEIAGAVPEHLRDWWEPSLWCLHSAPWWRHHWERTGIMSIKVADTMPNGWEAWLEWVQTVQTVYAENSREINALQADRGKFLGYVRMVGRRQPAVHLEDPMTSFPSQYVRKPLLRNEDGAGQGRPKKPSTP
jgi:cyclopropane fatty-acyl-phospholipid synthase-like methyltransferase